MESNGYKQLCKDCQSVWKHIDDYCPECGSSNIYEFHLDECDCNDCKKLLHIIKLKKQHQEYGDDMKIDEMVIIEALERFISVLDSLECECDSYNGFTCTLHKDKRLARHALNVARLVIENNHQIKGEL